MAVLSAILRFFAEVLIGMLPYLIDQWKKVRKVKVVGGGDKMNAEVSKDIEKKIDGKKSVILLLLVLLLFGCGGLKKDKIVKAPNSPMLITSGHATMVVSVYDEETNSMVEYGKVRIDEGMTVSNFDWQDFISRKGRQ